MNCSKRRGLVATYHDESRCLNCGAYYFPPDPTVERCTQGGDCPEAATIAGLCKRHHTQRMHMVNHGRNIYKRYRA